MTASDIEAVLSRYPGECRTREVKYLADAGGLSGARFWRLATARGPLCLRRWPREHPSRKTLDWIHRVLAYAARRGFIRLPLPLATQAGHTWVEHGGHLWQLEPWLAGDADWRDRPSAAKLRAAMTALAEFHCAVSSFPLPQPNIGPAPGILRRWQQLGWWIGNGVAQLARADVQSTAGTPDAIPEVLRLFDRVYRRVQVQLVEAHRFVVPQAPCICDIWHDNILFQAEQVSGIVDFGGMRPDSIAADIARLLGSLAGDDPASCQAGLESYNGINPLPPEVARLVEVFDRSNVLLSTLNWMRWLHLDERQFDNLEKVRERVETQLGRLSALASKI